MSHPADRQPANIIDSRVAVWSQAAIDRFGELSAPGMIEWPDDDGLCGRFTAAGVVPVTLRVMVDGRLRKLHAPRAFQVAEFELRLTELRELEGDDIGVWLGASSSPGPWLTWEILEFVTNALKPGDPHLRIRLGVAPDARLSLTPLGIVCRQLAAVPAGVTECVNFLFDSDPDDGGWIWHSK